MAIERASVVLAPLCSRVMTCWYRLSDRDCGCGSSRLCKNRFGEGLRIAEELCKGDELRDGDELRKEDEFRSGDALLIGDELRMYGIIRIGDALRCWFCWCRIPFAIICWGVGDGGL